MRCLTLIAIFLQLGTSAQNWCVPEARWTFAYNDILGGVVGQVRVEYTADTVLAGQPSQRLDLYSSTYSYQSQTYSYDVPSGSLFTTGTNDLVQLWNSSEQAFDTLYWFSAMPGDRWSVPWMYGLVDDFLSWIRFTRSLMGNLSGSW